MLTSPIKPPFTLPLPRSQLLLLFPSPHVISISLLPPAKPPAYPTFIVVPPAIALRPQYCLRLSQYWSYFSYLRSLSKNLRRKPTLRHRLPAATPAGIPYVTILTFHKGGPRKPIPPRSSVLIRIFILSDHSCVKSYVNVRTISVNYYRNYPAFIGTKK